MKKILSFIMVAIIATSTLVAIDVKDISATPTFLPEIRLAVPAFESGELVNALVQLKYEESEYTDIEALTDSDWHLSDEVATDYSTELFTVSFTSGLVNESSSSTDADTNYKITVEPGPFMNGTNVATTDGTEPFTPTAEFGTIGTLDSLPNASILEIQSPAVPINYYISGMDLADFTLEWTSIPFNTYVNTEGTYTSTTTVTIASI